MSENKLFYLSQFGETVPTDNDEMIKEAEMFSTGVHRGVEYTEDDLTELVNNFDASEEVPVQLDHSTSARDTVGYIQEASVKDGKLMGKLKIIDKYAKERIGEGLIKKLSVSFYLKYTEEGFKPHKIREVSLVAFPQVKSARLFSENGYVSEYEEKGGNDMSDKTQQFSLEDIVAQVRKTIETETADQFSELQKELDSLKGVKADFTEAQIATKIEKFQADNKVVPAQGEALKGLLASFSDEQAKLFEEFMKNQASVDFSEQGEVAGADGSEEDKRSDEEKDFDAFYEEHAKKYGTSL